MQNQKETESDIREKRWKKPKIIHLHANLERTRSETNLSIYLPISPSHITVPTGIDHLLHALVLCSSHYPLDSDKKTWKHFAHRNSCLLYLSTSNWFPNRCLCNEIILSSELLLPICALPLGIFTKQSVNWEGMKTLDRWFLPLHSPVLLLAASLFCLSSATARPVQYPWKQQSAQNEFCIK